MSKPNPFFRDLTSMLEDRYGWARTEMILDNAGNFYETLCSENAGETKAIKAHTVDSIYPCISLYRAMQKVGIPQPEALEFLDRASSRRAEKEAASLRAMMKVPGLHKLMPAIFRFVTKRTFGEKAGFAATFYETDKTRCKFDMTKCLYCDVCRRNGCPELTPCFCHTDDVKDGHMHPNLFWNRSKIMGDGADCCDFDLIVLQKGQTPEAYLEAAQAPDIAQ